MNASLRPALCALLLAGLTATAPAAKQQPGGDDPVVAQIESAMREGDFRRAVRLLDAAIRDQPTALFHAMRGGLRGEMNDLSGAIADLTDAVRLDPKLAVAWRDRGTARMLLGQLDLARADFDAAIQLDPREAKAWAARASLHVQSGATDAAIADATAALQLDPRMVHALHDRATAQIQKGEFRPALLDLDALLQAQPLNAPALATRAQVHRRLGDLDQALRDADQATTVDANFAPAYIERATLHGIRGDLRRAVLDCSTALLIDPDDRDGLMIRAFLYMQTGNFALARDDLAAGLRSPKCDPAVTRHNLAWLLAACPDPAVRDAGRATVLAREAIARYGDRSPHVYDALAAAAAEQGDFAAAVEHAEHSLTLTDARTPLELSGRRERLELYRNQRVYRLPTPTGEPSPGASHETGSRVGELLRKGDYPAGIALLEEAIRHLATPPTAALTGLAWLLATSPVDAQRDGPRAVKLARRALAQGGGAATRDALAAALAEAGDFPGAVAAAQEAIDLSNPEDSGEIARRHTRLEHYRQASAWRLPPPMRTMPSPRASAAGLRPSP